jgi:tetratricopeptide (TPR) repeat protein
MIRNSCAPKPDRYGLSAILNWKEVLLCVLGMAFSVAPICAQKNKSAMNVYRRAGRLPERVYSSTVDPNPVTNEERCFPWNLSGVQATTVSVVRLKASSKATSEYEKACDASNGNKFEEAEQHARNAIDKFQDYPAAWVMLGIILEEQHKAQEASDACSHAATIDGTYLPAHLCGAELSVRHRQWQQTLDAADQALNLKSEGDSYSYYYRAMALYHMNKLVEAKKNALQAAGIDVDHDNPFLYLLLAKIYEREGDNESAIAELQQLLKHHPDRRQDDAARQYLTKLESKQSAK